MTVPIKTFQLAASYTIGSYLLPGEPIETLSNSINKKIKVNICASKDIIVGIKNGQYDLGLIETPLFDDELLYKKWIKNEMVFCSKTHLPKYLNTELLPNYQLICREKSSETRKLIANFFKTIGIRYENFKSLKEINNITAAIQSVKWSKVNMDNPTLTVISKYAIENEIKYQELFVSRFKNKTMCHSYYIVYKEQHKESVDALVTELLKQKF